MRHYYYHTYPTPTTCFFAVVQVFKLCPCHIFIAYNFWANSCIILSIALTSKVLRILGTKLVWKEKNYSYFILWSVNYRKVMMDFFSSLSNVHRLDHTIDCILLTNPSKDSFLVNFLFLVKRKREFFVVASIDIVICVVER